MTDFQQLLANDPQLQALLQGLIQQRVVGQANLTGGQQQILGRLGETVDPSQLPADIAARLGNLGGALTPELAGIVQQANQAGVSSLAQLARQYHRAQSASIGSLSARGLIRSTGYAQHSNDNLHDYTLGQYQARQGALDALAGLQTGFLEGEQQRAGDAAQGTNDALGRITQQIQAGLIGGTPGVAPTPYHATTQPNLPGFTAPPPPPAYPGGAPTATAKPPTLAAPYKPPKLTTPGWRAPQ